jgi:beta-ribofuranosylaminobenzene 5'-phosphate synthase
MDNDISGVTIRTPARLHFSLIDLNGELGRIDGGLGVAIDKPNWEIKIIRNSEWVIPDLMELNELIKKLQKDLEIKNGYKIELNSILPEHVGLGSRTQLSLAIAQGLSYLEGKERTVLELADLVGRGSTSGIGIAAFEHGGFILDGGHSKKVKPDFLPSHFSSAKPAILVNRHAIPDEWYFVVAIPDVGMGMHGNDEVEIFQKHCPISSGEIDKLSRIILMQILPAVLENEIEQFGAGLNSIQQLGFKNIENQLQPKVVQDLQQFFIDSGAFGTGLSSFGPATFCVLNSEQKARDLVIQTNKFLAEHDCIGTIFFTKGNNTGAHINKIDSSQN